MNPSDLTSATAAEHVDDLRCAATRARRAAAARGCREGVVVRAARALHLTGRPDACAGA
ncbi:MAG: hypothetical protein U0S36_08905 [Candidatus Nanopelagicales bacterium]